MAITARYVFRFEDYQALVGSLSSRSGFGMRHLQLCLLGLMVFFWIVSNAEYGFSLAKAPGWLGLRKELIAEFIWLTICFGMLEAAIRLSVFERMGFRRCSFANQPVTYQLTSQGIFWSREGVRGEYDWSSVKATIMNPDAIALFIGKREGVILPARAFASRQKFEDAASFVRTKTDAEKSASGA